MIKKPKQIFNEKSFQMKSKTFYIIFKGLLLKQTKQNFFLEDVKSTSRVKKICGILEYIKQP